MATVPVEAGYKAGLASFNSLGGQASRHLVARLIGVEQPLLEPTVDGEGVLLQPPLLQLQVQLVALVEDLGLAQHAGEVAHLGREALLLGLQLLGEAVPEVKGLGQGGGEAGHCWRRLRLISWRLAPLNNQEH